MLYTSKASLILASVVVVASGFTYIIWKRRRSYVKVGKVSELLFYPVKSLKPVKVSEGECTKLGLVVDGLLDRSFMIVDSKGNTVDQEIEPNLTLLVPSVHKGILYVSTPNGYKLTLKIKDAISPGDEIIKCTLGSDVLTGVDCGEEAAEFFQNFLQKPGLRLVRYFSCLHERIYTKKKPFYKKLNKDHPVGFHNVAPLHILSEASVEDLNSKMDGHKVSALNFRPNIIISESKAFDEDSWNSIKLKSGVEMKYILSTARCLITTNDVETGIMNKKEPLVTMRKYRIHTDPEHLNIIGSKPCLGVTHAVLKTGKIKVGDEVFAVVGARPKMKNKLDS